MLEKEATVSKYGVISSVYGIILFQFITFPKSGWLCRKRTSMSSGEGALDVNAES